jgi:hypothetical protein
MLLLFAQTAEAVEIAKKASERLLDEWKVAGVLLIVLIGGGAFLIWYFISALEKQRKHMSEANESQRKEMSAANEALSIAFVKALKDERDACDSRHASLIASFEKRHESLQTSHAKEMQSHYDMMKEWRKEIINESKSMRDMVQLWVSRMALKTVEETIKDEEGGKTKKTGGA